MVIIDRRLDSGNKSSVNRNRFLHRFKRQIKKAVADTLNKQSIKDLTESKKINISNKELSEPRFRTGRGGIWEQVLPGNDQFITGEQIDRPEGGGGRGGSQASNDGFGYDDFGFTLSRDEFLNIFFDELELPNLVKKYMASLTEFKRHRAGFSVTGVPTNLNLIRTMKTALGRKIATRTPFLIREKKLKDELSLLLNLNDINKIKTEEEEEKENKLKLELLNLRKRIINIPFIDTFDLRYNFHVKVPQPAAQAVMFCLMDVSGSMDEDRKNIAKRFFTLLYLFLTCTYDHIDVVFIKHHTSAAEVDEDTFFNNRETGGTVVSTALTLMLDIIQERYANGQWNIYGAQASDGDNWYNDSSLCVDLLDNEILKLTQYFAYIEIADNPQNLWEEYTKLESSYPCIFAMKRIQKVSDIYPVFCELFKKQESQSV
jgi:uncharacterized protein